MNELEDEETSQAHNQAAAQETSLADEEEASSDVDLVDIDERDTAGLTQLLVALIPQPDALRARQLLRAVTPRPDPHLQHGQPTRHQVQPIPPHEKPNSRKRSRDDGKEPCIQDILQTQAKKARKERSQASTPTRPLDQLEAGGTVARGRASLTQSWNPRR